MSLRYTTTLLSVICFSLFSNFSFAQPEEGMRPRKRPPKEALSACDGQSSGATCSFSGRKGETVSGQCQSPSADKPLACVPENHKR